MELIVSAMLVIFVLLFCITGVVYFKMEDIFENRFYAFLSSVAILESIAVALYYFIN